MKREIKIIMSYDEEDIDECDATKPIMTGGIVLELDGHPIGCVQEIKFHAAFDDHLPTLEVIFPDLWNKEVDPAYRNTKYPSFAHEVEENIKRLKLIPNIKVTLRSIDDGTSRVVYLDEMGTDGHIDMVPMQRRNI